MGQHVWLLLATILTELLVIMKWSKGQFTEPFPRPVKWGWGIGATLLILYPTVQVSARSSSSVSPADSIVLYSLVSLVQESIFVNIKGKERRKPYNLSEYISGHHVIIHCSLHVLSLASLTCNPEERLQRWPPCHNAKMFRI